MSAISDRLADRLAPLRFLLPATALTLFGIVTVGGGPSLYALLILYGLLGKATVDPLASTVPRLPGPTAPLSRRGDCR
ncbi:MAG: hypothetical protein C4551_03010 [Bacillota bacterium]|nr:MAG: hypothetical protein C4551_03010 [Bacillota bacterium]